MISVDGMRPDYVTRADGHGLRIPTLRRFLTEGSYATGVVGVLPTLTYPSHTTLLTGVWPSEHGIYNNTEFYPARDVADPMYWFASEIRVPTLWDAAHAAGLKTASVSWPVSVGAKSVDYLIPEYSRGYSSDNNPDDRKLIAALSRPLDLFDEIEPLAGPYMRGNEETLEADEIRTRYSLAILRKERPAFMTVHLSSLDALEHGSGPFSEAADADLEGIDGMVGRLMSAVLEQDPGAVIVVVSDHGFAATSTVIRLFVPFIEEGLIQISRPNSTDSPRITAWEAEPWLASGTAAIVLRDPSDRVLRKKVRALLIKLSSDPANGISTILEEGDMKQHSGFIDAGFLVAFKPGFMVSGSLSGTLRDAASAKGTHGYLPDEPDMYSSFFVLGKGIAKGRDLGLIDMREIAPTLAQLLGLKLPEAKEPVLDVRP